MLQIAEAKIVVLEADGPNTLVNVLPAERLACGQRRQFDNHARTLKPDDYAQVRLMLPTDTGTVLVPASALTFRDSGMAVAIVGAGKRVVIRPISIERAFGTNVAVALERACTNRIVHNPPDFLRQGDVVRVARVAAPPNT